MKKKSTYGKSLIIAIIALIVVIAIIALYNALNLPVWPFLILLVCMAEIYHLDISKFWGVAISGAVGMIAGYVETLLGIAFDHTVAMVIFLVLLVLFVALDVDKNKIVANICWGGYALGAVILYAIILLLSKLGQKGKAKNTEAKA